MGLIDSTILHGYKAVTNPGKQLENTRAIRDSAFTFRIVGSSATDPQACDVKFDQHINGFELGNSDDFYSSVLTVTQ